MKIPHNKITFDEAEAQAVKDVVASGQWVGGAVMKKTEDNLAWLFDMEHAACVGSGLSALRLALLSLGLGSEDEVLIPAYSCVALANAVLSIGAVPVAVDSVSGVHNICPTRAKENITQKTKAIIAVNTFGQAADIGALKEFGLPVIEDCSHGFAVKGVSTPETLKGDLAIFSFYATKLVASGEGGAVLSNDKNWIDFCKNQRDYTDQAPDATRLNDKMTDIEAALVKVQLGKLQNFLEKRYKAAAYYDALFPQEIKPVLTESRVWYRYCLSLESSANLSDTIESIEVRGVSVKMPVENWLGSDIENYPNAQKAFKNTLSLPLYPLIKKEEQDYVFEQVKEILAI